MSSSRKLVKIAPAGEKTQTYLERLDKPTSPTRISSSQSTKSFHNSVTSEPSFLHNAVQQMQDDEDVFMEHEPIPQDILSVSNPTATNTTSTECSSSLTINTTSTSKDVIIHHATIYGKNSPRQLTSYEQAINQAAIELALQDPALVANKGILFEKAKEKLLREGYSYKRGASRSKLKQNDSEKAQVALAELEKERIEMGKELATLKSKERKHRWYEQKKKERMDSGFDESVEESLNDNNHEQQQSIQHEDS